MLPAVARSITERDRKNARHAVEESNRRQVIAHIKISLSHFGAPRYEVETINDRQGWVQG